ncbi:MAG: D-alanine--D-alanine ligase [Tissierellia bacterium]|nr:D-alanine--D-alanine ligase [Tissierellia bacterium]
MKTIGVIFGGRSVEHEVSVITGMQIVENIDKSKYKVLPIYIDKDGKWLVGKSLEDFRTYKDNDFSKTSEVYFKIEYGNNNLYVKGTSEVEAGGLFKKSSVKVDTLSVYDSVDVAVLALHGTNGEDGTVQGLLETIGIPYSGPEVLGSSAGMDKVVMKDVYKQNEIPVVNYTWFYRTDWQEDREAVLERIESKLSYPLFVKPSNLGSSIGISRATDRETLIEAIEVAASYFKKVIIEEAVQNPREINCAVLGYENNLETSLLEEPIGWKDILTFEDKYINSNNKGTKKGGERRNIPADLPEHIVSEIERLAKLSFKVLDCSGTARIDFLIDENEQVYVNEINTIPGSMGFYLWEKKGIDFKELISRLIEIALINDESKKSNMYKYDSGLYNKTSYGAKI